MIVLVLPDETGDSQLLERARRDDKSAVAQIYQEYVESIYQFVRLRVGDAQIAEDITSTVFMTLIDDFAKGKGPRSSLRGWLFQVARHKIYDTYGQQPTLPLETIDQLESFTGNPEVELGQTLTRDALRALIQQLSPDQQEILLLRFDQQLSLQETADIMNKNVNTVKTLQLRAVQRLRKLIQQTAGAIYE
ncbi:MAG: sigma-70 family RNA polymerase sigma factor [Anaerolineae bacterium]|nr:sigma-70 family RNA polymerase sigma factor [Anaerolineae bacterium]MDQ7035028.1 sigma-70 family RNA polymerase sigma factor [Anaerolineae bacterium]